MKPFLNHQLAGPESDTALLLIPAWGADRRMWEDCIGLWADRYRIVACDLRGTGQTPLPDQNWSLADHVYDLERLRTDLGLRRVIPVGCAMGAVYAAAYAAAYPENTASLVLCAPPFEFGDGPKARIRERATAVRTAGMQALVPAVIDRAFAEQPRTQRYDEYTRRFLENDPEGYAQFALCVSGANLPEIYARISTPTLITVGEHDLLFPPDIAGKVQACLPNSKLKVLPGSAHIPPFQTPRQFAEIVSEYLTSLHNGAG